MKVGFKCITVTKVDVLSQLNTSSQRLLVPLIWRVFVGKCILS